VRYNVKTTVASYFCHALYLSSGLSLPKFSIRGFHLLSSVRFGFSLAWSVADFDSASVSSSFPLTGGQPTMHNNFSGSLKSHSSLGLGRRKRVQNSVADINYKPSWHPRAMHVLPEFLTMVRRRLGDLGPLFRNAWQFTVQCPLQYVCACLSIYR